MKAKTFTYPERKTIKCPIYLRIGDFRLNKDYELYFLIDFINNIPAKLTLQKVKDLIDIGLIQGKIHINIYHINNFRKKLYKTLRRSVGDRTRVGFEKYCQNNQIDLEQIKSSNSGIIRAYLREVYDIKAPIEVLDFT